MNAVARDIEYAANHVQTANHSTMRGPLSVPETYDVVANLVDMTRRLPQVVDFLVRSVTRADPAEHFDDRGGDVRLTKTVALAGLFEVRPHLDELATFLDRTHNALGHLGRHVTED